MTAATAVAAAGIGGAVLCALHAPAYLLPLGWVAGALGTHMAAILGHEAVHGSLASSPVVNDVAGHLYAALSATPFRAFRREHQAHHRHTNDPLRDTVWVPLSTRRLAAVGPLVRAAYRASRTWAWWLGPLVYNVRLLCDAGSWRRWPDALSSMATLLLVVTFAGLLLAAGGTPALVHGGLLPLLGYGAIMGWASLAHHAPVDPELRAAIRWSATQRLQPGATSTTLRLPRGASWLLGHTGYHWAHHMAPRTPFHALPALDRQLRARARRAPPSRLLSLAIIRRQVATPLVLDGSMGTLVSTGIDHAPQDPAPSDRKPGADLPGRPHRADDPRRA